MGAFTNFSPLLQNKLALTLKSETVILAEIHPYEAQRLRKLPSLLYEIDEPSLEGIYAIRPIEYSDGRFFLKMGCNLPDDITFTTLEEIQTWFRSGNSDDHIYKMLAALMAIMPNLRVGDCVSKRCILTRTTSHGNPYIGQINDHLTVAIGNGYSAMCSDGIGHVAAHLMMNNLFPANYDPNDYALAYSD